MTARRAPALIAAIFGALAIAGCTGNTTGATNVTATSATLNASGKCDNSCNVRFRYHVDEGPWTYTPYQHFPSTGGNYGPVHANIGNLSAASSYSYQACGDDQGKQGEVCVGPDGSISSSTAFTTPDSTATRVKLMTYNVEYFARGTMAQIVSDIQASGASIVALEEVRQFSGANSEAQQVATKLGWNTGGQHVLFKGFSNANTLANGCKGVSGCQTLGNAIISRYPLTIPNPYSKDLYYTHGLKRNIIWADAQIGGSQTLRVYATHLASIDPDNRPADETYTAQQLLDAVNTANSSSRSVLMGDFNLPYDAYSVNDRPYGNSQRTFDPLAIDGFHDWKIDRLPVDRDSGLPGGDICNSVNAQNKHYYPCTYVNPSPSDKRDYIWVKGYPMAAGAVPANCPDANCNSDHRPYWTEIIP